MASVAVSGGCLVAAASPPLASAASMVEVTLEVTTATTATARLATPSHKVAVYPLPRAACADRQLSCAEFESGRSPHHSYSAPVSPVLESYSAPAAGTHFR